jgi:hypothetical protein
VAVFDDLIRPILLRPFTTASAFCTPVGLRLLDLHLTIQSVNSNRSGVRIHRLRHAATPNLHSRLTRRNAGSKCLNFRVRNLWATSLSDMGHRVIFPPAVSERACRAEISTAYSSIPLYLHCLIPSHNIWPSPAVCSFRDVFLRLEFPVRLRLDTTPTWHAFFLSLWCTTEQPVQDLTPVHRNLGRFLRLFAHGSQERLGVRAFSTRFSARVWSSDLI